MADDCRPRAIFMAFGTQGDVFPIAVTLSPLLYLFKEMIDQSIKVSMR